MTFSYFEESRAVAGTGANYDRASYLDTISYTSHTSGTPAAGYSVVFARESRGTGEVPTSPAEWDNWDTERLDRIDIKYGAVVVRSYDLTYQVGPYGDGGENWHTTILTSVAISGGGTAAPTVTFSYVDKDNRAPNGTGSNEWPYPRLQTVANGWGGSSTFTYENDGRPSTSWYNWRVLTLDVSDGVPGHGAMQTFYEYVNPCYKVTNPPADWTCNSTNPGELVGYDQINAFTNNFAGGALLAKDIHKFHTDLQKAGREYEVERQNAAGTTLSKTSTTYTVVTAGLPAGGYFTYASAVDQYLYSTSLVQVSHTEYTCDPATGNLTLEKEFSGASTLYRQTAYQYVTNTSPSVWILSTLSKRQLKNASGTVVSQQQYGYDGSLPGSGSPTVGKLTLGRVVNGGGTQTIDTTYFYDTYGNVTETRLFKSYGSTSSQPSGAYLSYFTSYNDDASTTEDENLQTFATSSTNPLGHITRTHYDFGLGVPLTVTDPNSQVTTSTYDGLGRVLTVKYPGSAQANLRYSYPTLPVSAPFAVKTEIWDDSVSPAVYRSAWQILDGLGRAIQTQGPHDTAGMLVLQDTLYNAQGLAVYSGMPRSLSGAGGAYYAPDWGAVPHTTASYDALGRAVGVQYPDASSESASYSGLRATFIDRNSHKKVQENDAFGRLIKVEEYTGSSTYTLYATTNYAYNVRDQLSTVTDAAGNPTTITYDNYGRKTGMSDPDMGSWSYAYDVLGNLTRQTDARGQRVCLYYDALNRLTGKHYRSDNNCPTSPTYNITYGYDIGVNGKGHRTSMTDASGSASWTYDARGRMTAESKTITGATTFNTSWSYSSADQLKSMTYPDGEVVNYNYNNRMLLNSVSGSSVYVSSTGYDEAGRVTQRNYGNTTQTTYTYFPWTTQGGRLQVLQSGTAGSPASLQDLTYTYDAGGSVLTILDGFAGAETQTFTYDELDRLKSADVSGGSGGGIYHQNYTYAANGNMLTIGSQTNTYDTIHKHAVLSQSGGNSYQYDANGNMTRRVSGTETYDMTYDAENHLTQVKLNGVLLATITYDGDGKRVVSTVTGGNTIRFIGDYYEYRSSSSIDKYYFAGGQRVAMRDSGVLTYFLGDHLGSTSITTNASGAFTSELRYKAFGDTRYTSGGIPTRYRFTGQRSYTPDFGLYYYGSRWYDPALGRFIQPDTIVPNPANPQDLNRFSYVRNNPLRYTDPTGHRACDDFDTAGSCYTAPGGGGMGFGGSLPKPKPKPQPDPEPAPAPIPSIGGGGWG
jgi:RHS repeat-associated protein